MATTEAERPTAAEELEARCRKAMATLPEARGWDSQRVREDELAMIDVLLDEWLALTHKYEGADQQTPPAHKYEG